MRINEIDLNSLIESSNSLNDMLNNIKTYRDNQVKEILNKIKNGSIDINSKANIIIKEFKHEEYIYEGIKVLIGNNNNNALDDMKWEAICYIISQSECVNIINFLKFIKAYDYKLDNNIKEILVNNINNLNDILETLENLKSDDYRIKFLYYHKFKLKMNELKIYNNNTQETILLIMMTFENDEYKYEYCTKLIKYTNDIDFIYRIIDLFETTEYKIKFIYKMVSSGSIDLLLAKINNEKKLEMKKN